MITLMTTAAELRTSGMSWEFVGKKVHRLAGTCFKWPSRYRREWNRIYMDALRQRYEEVSNESLTYFGSLLHSKVEKIRLIRVKRTLPVPKRPSGQRVRANFGTLRNSNVVHAARSRFVARDSEIRCFAFVARFIALSLHDSLRFRCTIRCKVYVMVKRIRHSGNVVGAETLSLLSLSEGCEAIEVRFGRMNKKSS